MRLEARDYRGANKGLHSSVSVIVHVVDTRHQLKMVLSSDMDAVMHDMNNITK